MPSSTGKDGKGQDPAIPSALSEVIHMDPARTQRILERAADAAGERIRREEEERQERLRREREPQGVCPHCGGNLHFLDIHQPVTAHTLIGGPVPPPLARFLVCMGRCKTTFFGLPEQPDPDTDPDPKVA